MSIAELQERAERAFATGQCIRCTRHPARPDKLDCASCAKASNDRHAKLRTWKGGRYGTARCGLCGELGHYRPRCPRRTT